MTEKTASCLMTANQAQIPLQGVRIDARVDGLCSEVTVTQRYYNAESVDVEAVYAFPLEEGSAVCGFEARVGDRVIKGKAEEKEKAFEIYDEAMSAGHGAMLLDQERPNIFTASVGNLKPKQTIEISLRYVALLNFEGPAVRLMIPTTISPRYVPATTPEVGQPDAERINPETRDQVPYGLTLKVQVDGSSPIQEVESPSHPIKLSMHDKGATVTLSTQETALDRDFVLLVKPKEAYKPIARVAKEADGTKVAMVTFYPDPAGLPNTGNEILFLLDCSGSMQGDSIEQAKRAMALCVRALSENDAFNIIRFGSGFQSLWKTPQPYNQKNLEEATKHMAQIQADLGGTEILAPLKHLLEMKADEKKARQILLLTDGEVGNEADVIELCKKHADVARVFAFGIGAGVSEHLVRGVARASKGAAEFIYPGERIEPKVLRMFNRVNTPSVQKVTLDWRGLDVEQAPAVCPPVFAGDSVTVFARIKSGNAYKTVLHADEQSWEVSLDLGSADAGDAIPVLWARQTIRDLEDAHGAPAKGSNQSRGNKEDRKRAKIVELGVKYGLMSSATSYVAVEERTNEEKTQGQAQLRKVPIALTKGWHGKGSVMPMAPPMVSANITMAGGYGPGAPPPPMGMPAPAPSAAAPPMMKTARRQVDYFASMPAEQDEAEYEEMDMVMDDTGAFDHDIDDNTIVKGGAGLSREEASKKEVNAPAKGGLLSRLFGSSGEKAKKASPPKPSKMDAKSVAAPPPPPQPVMQPAAMPSPARPAALSPGFAGAASSAADRVFDLLMTQQADGSFKMSDVLKSWLGARAAAVEEKAKQDGETLVVTAVVLELLRKEAASRQDEWGPAAAKAVRWLSGQSKKVDVSGLV